MTKDVRCLVCKSFLNREGRCLTCNPKVRQPKKPWHGNTKAEKKKRRPS